MHIKNIYSIGFWFWNGLPADVREYTGFLFADGGDVSLGIGGNLDTGAASRLILTGKSMGGAIHPGITSLDLKEWNHVLLVRDNESIRILFANSLHQTAYHANIAFR